VPLTQPPSQDDVEGEAGVDNGEEDVDSQGEVAREHGPERRQEGRPPVGERGPAEEGDPATGVKFGGCGTSRDAAARRTATSKKAGRGDTSGDGMRDPGARRGVRSHSSVLGTLSPSCRSGRMGCRTGGAGGLRTRGMNLTCRVPGSGAPLASLDGQVFWLTARRAPDGLPASRQWRFLSGGLAEYSGGPAPGSHRLPYSPPPSARGGGTYREDILQASDLGESSLRAPRAPR